MLNDIIKKDFMVAYKAKDKIASETLKMIKSSIQYKIVELKGKNREINDDDIVKILKIEAKKRKESIDQYIKAGRDKSAEKEQKEFEIISKYLPELMSFDNIKKEVSSIISDLNATSMKDFGLIMKESSKKLSGKAEGYDIKKAVEEILIVKD
ncbi:MAG: GatB/YqeY domain-containing protein [Caldisericia bacterium]|nr:GatB/YqeY domain-containing protein [Caldisericia bacterium]